MSGAGGWKRDPETGQWTANAPQSGPFTPPPTTYAPPPAGYAPPPRPTSSSTAAPDGTRPTDSWSSHFNARSLRFGTRVDEATGRRSGRGPWIALGIGAALVVILGIAASVEPAAEEPSTMTIRGSVTDRSLYSYTSSGSGCMSRWSLQTITIYNDAGLIVGTTTLSEKGERTSMSGYSGTEYSACKVSYVVLGVPSSSCFFRIAVTNDPSEAVTFSADEAERGADVVANAF